MAPKTPRVYRNDADGKWYVEHPDTGVRTGPFESEDDANAERDRAAGKV